ncbi:unnamed protein product [Ectocarpus sp. 12 AP-2014]
MERYSKESPSKWQSRYSEEFKRFVCNDFLMGTVTRREIETKYNLGNSLLTKWLKDIGYDYTRPSMVPLPNMGKQSQEPSKSNDKSLTQLEKELQEARLLAETYRKMIEVAEREFKIKIVKKSNTK